MPAGQHEPVPAEPVRVGRVMPQDALEQQVGGGGQAHRRARMARCRPSAPRPWPGPGSGRRPAGRRPSSPGAVCRWAAHGGIRAPLLARAARLAGRGNSVTCIDPIPSFAYSPGPPPGSAWHTRAAGCAVRGRYAPCHGDPDARLRPAGGDRGPASGPAAGRAHPGHRGRHRLRASWCSARTSLQSVDAAGHSVAPFLIALPLALLPVPLLVGCVLLAGPAGARAAGQPGARVRLGGRGRRAARGGDQHRRAGLHHPARAGQHHRRVRVGHVRRPGGGGVPQGPGPDHPAVAAPPGAGRPDRRDHLRGHGRPGLRHDGEHRLLHRRAGPSGGRRGRAARRHVRAARRAVPARAPDLHLDDRARGGLRGHPPARPVGGAAGAARRPWCCTGCGTG